jgi:tRNA(Ile)-lysidine synthase TilS/MesJ
MKCTVCREPASVKTQHHRGLFCRDHFRDHVLRQVSRVIDRYRLLAPGERVLLGVSGGKDSMAAWDILRRLGYDVLAFHINNGFGEHSAQSEALVREFAAQRGWALEIVSMTRTLGFDFETARLHSRRPACGLCGTLKRYVLNQAGLRFHCDAVATGHNLDDESALLLGNLLHWHDEYLRRQYPLAPAEPGMARKIKPLVRLTDEETRQYAAQFCIPVFAGRCPHSRGATSHAHKRILAGIEREFSGTIAQFYFGYVERVRAGRPVAPPGWRREARADSPSDATARCAECGYKTLHRDRCYVCTLKRRVAGSEAHAG